MKRRTKILLAAVAAALVVVAAAVAATVSISSQTASATWLGLTNAPVVAAPTLSDPTLVSSGNGVATYVMPWKTVINATAYRIWIDGKPTAVVPWDGGPSQSRLMTFACGLSHRWNNQGLNGQSVGPIAAKPVYFTTAAC